MSAVASSSPAATAAISSPGGAANDEFMITLNDMDAREALRAFMKLQFSEHHLGTLVLRHHRVPL
jgi:hypothetical protein